MSFELGFTGGSVLSIFLSALYVLGICSNSEQNIGQQIFTHWCTKDVDRYIPSFSG